MEIKMRVIQRSLNLFQDFKKIRSVSAGQKIHIRTVVLRTIRRGDRRS